MVKTPSGTAGDGERRLTSAIDAMLVDALDRGDESMETGRYVVTYKEGAVDQATSSLQAKGMRVADARDFGEDGGDAGIQDVGDADALFLPEVGVAIVTAAAGEERGMGVASDAPPQDETVEAVEPEYFAFTNQFGTDYLRGFKRAIDSITEDYEHEHDEVSDVEEIDAQVLGATWGLVRCRVPLSARSGAGIRIAVLDTGMDLGHPDFGGRSFAIGSFVGQPVHDLHSHGTHCIGTAAGPRTPPGTTPRYGIGWRAPIFVGKVLTNSGSGTTGSVLAGMNWAIANRCTVISMSLGSSSPPQAAYTAAGRQALLRGCLIVAAAGNSSGPTGAPANSPTIMSVASLDSTLRPSSFSNFGKIEIAAPGRDVFSSVPRPRRYGVMSGTSMATPHVAGCAALWAETSPSLRGAALWRKLQATARRLPFPPSRVGAGLVQAP